MHPLQRILQIIQSQYDVNDFEIRSYSGRFMYGKECLAVVCDNFHLIELGFLIKQLDYDDEINHNDLRQMRSDNMGLGTVIYFPRIPYIHPHELQDEEIIIDEA